MLVATRRVLLAARYQVRRHYRRFCRGFETLGYVTCPDSVLEKGWEKVALFAKANDEPAHAARQLESGRWTSKLGGSKDIAHELEAVCGPYYGNPVLFMKRPRR